MTPYSSPTRRSDRLAKVAIETVKAGMRIKPNRGLFIALEAAYADSSDDPILPVVPLVKARRQLSSSDLQIVCRWKSPRALPRVRENSDDEVREVTGWALTTEHERLRIETLLLLHGVGWPTASVVLHWFHSDPYPVMDIRALWSLGLPSPNDYTFTFWWRYVLKCRDLSQKLGLSMRSVDRALWQYSKQKGGPGTAA